MENGRPTAQRPALVRESRVRRRAPLTPTLLPVLLVASAFALMPTAISFSPLIGLGAIAVLLVFVGFVAVVGADRASTYLLVLAFGFSPLTSFGLGLKPLVLASAIFAVSFALALPRLLVRPLRLPGVYVLGSVLFTVMGFLAIPIADSPFESLIYLVTALVAFIAIPVAVAWMAPTPRQMYAMAVAFGIGSAISTAAGFPYVYRNQGFTYHPVALAYTAMLAISFVPFILASKERTRWLFAPPIVVAGLVAIWTSGSRTGLVVIMALVLVIPLMERSIRLGLAVAAGCIVAIPAVLTLDTSGNATSALSRLTTGGGGGANSNTVRLETIADGLEQIQRNPVLGNGYSVEGTYVIHNLYLQVLAAEGILGLVGIVLMLAVFIRPLTHAPTPYRQLGYPALAVILAGPFQPNMADHYLALTLGLALLAAVHVMKRPSTSGDPPGQVVSQPTPTLSRV